MNKKSQITSRREFLKKSGFATGAAFSGLALHHEAHAHLSSKGKFLRIQGHKAGFIFKPLEEISISSTQEGSIAIYDSLGQLYLEKPIKDSINFKAGGSLGGQLILLLDHKDRVLDAISFTLDCQTEIVDDDGNWARFAKMLEYTVASGSYNAATVRRMNGKNYHYFSSWFQDHMYVMKAAKYFYPELKSGVDLYAEGQRHDGMIHDNYKHPYDPDSHWISRFEYGNFVTLPGENSSCIFVRVPVENMAEFTFLETIYYTWKATGDTQWMSSLLDKAIKAVEYSTTDSYRWSEKYQLLKRGYTIDIWDFQTDEDSALAGNDTMRIYLHNARFGIMYGDNVRMAASCEFLAEMLTVAGRQNEAENIRTIGKGLKERIDKLAWNGDFYTHHIPEKESYQRDFGDTDTDAQVTMSNAWALNRGVTHEQAVAIIRTYQRIQKEMPETSPGEWYCCYPPFEKGFSHSKWNYMNGGVSPICAGELAHGAFEHGFETYAVDILRRVDELAELTDYTLQGCYKGKMPSPPEQNFTILSLRDIANADTHGTGAPGVPGWTGEGDNDFHEFPAGRQEFENIPFEFVDPADNGRKACLILSGDPAYVQEASLETGQKAKAIYLVHGMSQGEIAGSVKLHYADGTHYTKYIKPFGGKHGAGEIRNWWYPSVPEPRKGIPHLKVAWRGENIFSKNVGACIYGLENPHGEKVIEKITFHGQDDDTKWMILGVTLSDAPVFMMPTIVSTIPKHWAAAECYYALMEGLAGIKDTGVAFDKALLAPRWEAAGVKSARATARYAASGGYLSYQYNRPDDNKLHLLFTSSAEKMEVKVLVPNGKRVEECLLNNSPTSYTMEIIEKSSYMICPVEKAGVHEVTVNLS